MHRLVSLSSGIKMKNNSSVLLLPSFAINSTAKAFYYLHLPMLLSLSMLFQARLFKGRFSQVVLRRTNHNHSSHSMEEISNRVPGISTRRSDG
ncbi:hypothetical protein POUND7_019095 [Theobroma cacao]